MENKIHFDRSRQPETVIPERLEVPEACEYRTASGVRIYVLPAPEYGVVRLSSSSVPAPRGRRCPSVLRLR